MAEKEIERTYVIPLRREFLKVPKYKRAKKAVTALKEFLLKHTKAKEVRLGKRLNEEVWKHGIKNPPHHVKVNVTKGADGIANAELFGFEFKEKKAEKKKQPETLKEKLTEKLAGSGKKDEAAKPENQENPEEEKTGKPKETKTPKKAIEPKAKKETSEKPAKEKKAVKKEE